MDQGINLVAICIADGFGAFLAILMLGARLWRNSSNKIETRLVRLMLLAATVSCVSDMLAFIFDGHPGFGMFLIVYFSNIWLYVSNMLMGTLWIVVLVMHINNNHFSKTQLIITIILDAIGVVALFANFFYPIIFSVNYDNVYSRGGLFWIFWIIEFAFGIDGLIFYFSVKSKNKDANYFPVWQYITPLVAGMIIQYHVYGVSLICPAVSVAICGLVMGLFSKNEAENEMLRQNEKNALIILQQEEKLKEALNSANEQQRKTEILHDIIHSGKWSFFVNFDDKIVHADFSDALTQVIKNDIPADDTSWARLIHPDDKDRAIEAFNATIKDHSCNTPYDINYRMIDREGKYHWFHSAGRMVRDELGNGEFFGVQIDITKQMEEQAKRILGALPFSSDVLLNAGIGLCAIEIDEGKTPRMYVDEATIVLLGIDENYSPQDTYLAWYGNIDENSILSVNEATEKMINGEHAEAQYLWHHPDKNTKVYRFGGLRNYEYKVGIRIEGTLQNVSEVIRFDREEAENIRKANELDKVKRTLNLIFALSDEYNPIIVIEPESGNYEWLMSKNTSVDKDTSMSIRGDDIYQNILIDGSTIVHRDDRERFMRFYSKKNLLQIAETGESQEIENRWFIKDENVYRWKYNKAVRMYDDNNTAYVVVGVMDTTEKKDRENKFEEQKKQLEEALSMAQSADRAKTMFLNNMSHDIRTPMNAIIGYTNLCSQNIDNEGMVSDYLGKIKQSSDYLLSLINDVLDMSRIESGKIQIDEKKENLYDILNSLSNIVKADVDSRHHEFVIDYKEVKNAEVYCDKLKLTQVLLNIVSNSIKYTNDGGLISLIVNQTDNDKNYATYEFCVKDNGIGMEEEYVKTIFEPFTRMYTSTVSGIQGTGLGMSIAKNIIDRMGGRISVKSQIDVGTEISVFIDLKKVENNKIPSFIETSKKDDNDSFSFEGKTILLVEDNELNREIVTEFLSEKGMNIIPVEDGDIAVELMNSEQKDKIDLILMDIQMPRMDGYEATMAIRKLNEKGAGIPIVALTANAFEEDKKRALDSGMDDFITKPIDLKKMYSVLSKFI